MLKDAQMKCSVRNKCITRGSLLVELERILTTAILSHLNKMCRLHQYGPHVVAASRMGSNSFVWIGTSPQEPFHGHCIHLHVSVQNAPHPQLPEASVVTVKCGLSVGATACIMALPFHETEKRHHQERSDLNSADRRTQ